MDDNTHEHNINTDMDEVVVHSRVKFRRANAWHSAKAHVLKFEWMERIGK